MPGTPSNPATDPGDIVSLSIGGENETHITFSLKLAGLNVDVNRATNLLSGFYYSTEFLVNGQGDTWILEIYYSPTGYSFITCCPPAAFGGPFVRGSLYLYAEEEFHWDFQGTVPIIVDWEQATFHAVLDRSMLRLEGRSPAEALPVAGDRITDIVAFSNTGLGTLHSDRLPDSGAVGDFVFSRSSADTLLEIAPAAAYGGQDAGHSDTVYFVGGGPTASASDRAVLPGKAQAFPLTVANRDSVKRIVNLTATLESASGASDWQAKIVPNLQLPAHESATVNLLVTAPATAAHRETVVVKVRGVPVGVPDAVGLEEFRLFAARSPTPAENVLHFHSHLEGSGAPTDAAERFLFGYPETALNTQRDDPAYNEEPLKMGIWFDSDGYSTTFSMDTPLGQDLAFDRSTPIQVRLALSADLETTYDMEAALYASGTHIGTGVAREVLSTSPKEVLLEFTPSRTADRIPATGGRMDIELRFREDKGPATEHAFLHAAGVIIDPAGSYITLPLLDPGVPELSVSTGEFLPSLRFARGSAPETYVNPGRAAAFNLSLVNEGTRDDAIQVKLGDLPPGWAAELSPGAKFKLASGEKANLTLRVRAPAGAAEGDTLKMSLQAVSASDARSSAKTQATIVVTRSIDIPDAAPNAVEKSDRKDAPAGLMAPIAAMIAVAVLLQRTRERRLRP